MVIGFVRGEDLAMLYGVRATVLVGRVLILMIRLDYYLPALALVNSVVPEWLRNCDVRL